MRHHIEYSDLISVQDNKELSNQALLALLQAVLATGNAFRFSAPGNSMDPFIKNGDILTVVPIQSHLMVGDIVVFIEPSTEHVTVHRVIRIAKGSNLTRGDAVTTSDDGWIPDNYILGRVIRIQRKDTEIRLGLGPEKWLITFLSIRGLLPKFVSNPFFHMLIKRVTR